MTALHTAIDNNYDKLFDLLSDDNELKSHVGTNNFHRDEAAFLDTNWPMGIAVLDPQVIKDQGAFGLDGYILNYKIQVYTRQLSLNQSREILNKMMFRIAELCDLKTNTDLSGTCTYMNVVNINPRPKHGMLVSGKTARRKGEIDVQTHIQLQLTS
jgi:hypothetical protein